MTYQFKVGDKGKTRGGRKYEIICVNRRSSDGYRIVALLEDQYSMDTVMCYKESGIVHASGTSLLDLLPPTTTAYWATFFHCASGYYTLSRSTVEQMDHCVEHEKIACVNSSLVARGTCEVDHEGKRSNFVVTN